MVMAPPSAPRLALHDRPSRSHAGPAADVRAYLLSHYEMFNKDFTAALHLTILRGRDLALCWWALADERDPWNAWPLPEAFSRSDLRRVDLDCTSRTRCRWTSYRRPGG